MGLVSFALAGCLLGTGCFANPTPHPQEDVFTSTADFGGENAADAMVGDAAPSSALEDAWQGGNDPAPALDAEASEGMDAADVDAGDSDSGQLSTDATGDATGEL